MKIERAIEILDKMEFFQGQRAGRELWAEKPTEVQNEDIANFCRDLGIVREALERTRWIPCSERLPDLPDGEWAYRTVIVCVRGHTFPLSYEREKVRGKTVERWKWTWNRIYEKPDSITHWMPMPEPPESDVCSYGQAPINSTPLNQEERWLKTV